MSTEKNEGTGEKGIASALASTSDGFSLERANIHLKEFLMVNSPLYKRSQLLNYLRYIIEICYFILVVSSIPNLLVLTTMVMSLMASMPLDLAVKGQILDLTVWSLIVINWLFAILWFIVTIYNEFVYREMLNNANMGKEEKQGVAGIPAKFFFPIIEFKLLNGRYVWSCALKFGVKAIVIFLGAIPFLGVLFVPLFIVPIAFLYWNPRRLESMFIRQRGFWSYTPCPKCRVVNPYNADICLYCGADMY